MSAIFKAFVKGDEEAKQLVKKPSFFPESMYALVKEAYRDLKSQIFILSAKQWQIRITENLITHVRDPATGSASLLPSPSEELWPAGDWSQSRLNLKLGGLSPDQKSTLFKLCNDLFPYTEQLQNSNLPPQQGVNSARRWMGLFIFSTAPRRRAWAPSSRRPCPHCSSQRSRSRAPK